MLLLEAGDEIVRVLAGCPNIRNVHVVALKVIYNSAQLMNKNTLHISFRGQLIFRSSDVWVSCDLLNRLICIFDEFILCLNTEAIENVISDCPEGGGCLVRPEDIHTSKRLTFLHYILMAPELPGGELLFSDGDTLTRFIPCVWLKVLLVGNHPSHSVGKLHHQGDITGRNSQNYIFHCCVC